MYSMIDNERSCFINNCNCKIRLNKLLMLVMNFVGIVKKNGKLVCCIYYFNFYRLNKVCL